MKFYIVRISTNTIIMTLYKNSPAEASAYVYKWYGDNNDIDLFKAEDWEG